MRYEYSWQCRRAKKMNVKLEVKKCYILDEVLGATVPGLCTLFAIPAPPLSPLEPIKVEVLAKPSKCYFVGYCHQQLKQQFGPLLQPPWTLHTRCSDRWCCAESISKIPTAPWFTCVSFCKTSWRPGRTQDLGLQARKGILATKMQIMCTQRWTTAATARAMAHKWRRGDAWNSFRAAAGSSLSP